MGDAITGLAREFLEFNYYFVKEFVVLDEDSYIQKGFEGVAIVDVIATSLKGADFGEFKLGKEVVAGVKNWNFNDKRQVDQMYEAKLKLVDKFDISWKDLNKWISSKKFDKVLFCSAATTEVCDYALKKYGIRIITTGFIIKQFCKMIKDTKAREGKDFIFIEGVKQVQIHAAYYPDAVNYGRISAIIDYLNSPHKYKDKLAAEDFLISLQKS